MSGSFMQWLASLPPDDSRYFLARLDGDAVRHLDEAWKYTARPEQLPPEGDWHIWLILAGRGFGKTRAGTEWVHSIACDFPDARIALVGANLGDARRVMVEGQSGILPLATKTHKPNWEPSLRQLTWPNGAQAFLYSAADPESLRGPEHSHAWCDEIAKWDNSSGRAEDAWSNLELGLRVGRHPRLLATTTPRRVPLLLKLIERSDIRITTGSTLENRANLPAAYLEAMQRTYGQTRLGRQELDGELLHEVEGALWSGELLERVRRPPFDTACERIVIGVDPPASAIGDACGIVVAGVGADRIGVVLADCSVERALPERWARAVAEAADTWQADRIVAEANQGGAMVESVLRAVDAALPVRLVHASRGKSARAEPIAALYEAGRVIHAGLFHKLEDQLRGMMTAGEYRGPGRSPDRADALVWALTELMLKSRGDAAVRTL